MRDRLAGGAQSQGKTTQRVIAVQDTINAPAVQ